MPSAQIDGNGKIIASDFETAVFISAISIAPRLVSLSNPPSVTSKQLSDIDFARKSCRLSPPIMPKAFSSVFFIFNTRTIIILYNGILCKCLIYVLFKRKTAHIRVNTDSVLVSFLRFSLISCPPQALRRVCPNRN